MSEPAEVLNFLQRGLQIHSSIVTVKCSSPGVTALCGTWHVTWTGVASEILSSVKSVSKSRSFIDLILEVSLWRLVEGIWPWQKIRLDN